MPLKEQLQPDVRITLYSDSYKHFQQQNIGGNGRLRKKCRVKIHGP